MALSLYDWVEEVFKAGLFAQAALVLGLTSEGSTKAWRSYAAVSVAKAGLEALCRSIALEYAAHGIRCNVIQAGVTDTPSLRMIPGSEQLKKGAIEKNQASSWGRTPEKRPGVAVRLVQQPLSKYFRSSSTLICLTLGTNTRSTTSISLTGHICPKDLRRR